MSAHTPGPWDIQPSHDELCSFCVMSPDGYYIATAHDGVRSESNAEANARLIASAPDLLEALLAARDHIDMDALEVSHCKDAQRIREAIAKATGQKGGA